MSDWKLARNEFAVRPGPVALVVLDGVGIGRGDETDAVHLANTPVLDRIWGERPTVQLMAHGTAVGLPSDGDMGNSEVGHNALGAGRVFEQGAKLVAAALASGEVFRTETWRDLTSRCAGDSSGTLHFIGLLSDGNVHSHIDHLVALLRGAVASDVRKVRIHALLDGRDVEAQSSLTYVHRLEAALAQLTRDGTRDYRIASGGGRMLVTMDRYEADWQIVERGWWAHVLGRAERFGSAGEAIETFRRREPGLSDQHLPPFVVADDGGPVGTIGDGDAVVLFNFRGDRALEITRAFESDDFPYFDRVRRPEVKYAGMMQYDGDLRLPRSFLVQPPAIERTVGEYLARNGISQLACSETQKFGHVTYFFNGNRSDKFDAALEDYVEIPSDRVRFEQRPWMKAAEITDAVVASLDRNSPRFLRINYANGDMVGHTGDLRSAVLAMEAVDLSLGRLLAEISARDGVAIVTADHGNADQMFQTDRSGEIRRRADGEPEPHTSHTLNPVRLSIVDPLSGADFRLRGDLERPGLSNVAATALFLLGFQAPGDYDRSLITPR